MKWCIVEYVAKLSLISGNSSNIDHKLWMETLINIFCRKFTLDAMLLCKASRITIARKLCIGSAIEMKLCLPTKMVDRGECLESFVCVHFRENSRNLEQTNFLERWRWDEIERIFDHFRLKEKLSVDWLIHSRYSQLCMTYTQIEKAQKSSHS